MALHFSGRDKDGTHRISGGSSPEPIKARPIQNIVAYRDLEDDWTGGKIPFTGFPEYTLLDTLQVIVNGVVLDSSQYRFDFKEKVIHFNFSLMKKHLYVEVRSKPSSIGKAASVVIDDVVVLPVSKYVTEESLRYFIPELGDTVSIDRIRDYEQNASIVESIEEYNLAQIIEAHVKKDGLYATVKFSIQ